MKALLFSTCAVVSTLLCLSGCVKDKTAYTISGRIYQDCNKIPFANQTLSFYQEISSGLTSTSGGEVATATTDAEGNFSVSYEAGNSETIRIQTPAGFGYGTLMGGVPAKKNIEGLLIYADPRYNLQVGLNVINPHSIGDTLFLMDIRNYQAIKIPCPLTSGAVYTATGLDLPAMGYERSATEIKWYFKSTNTNNMEYQVVSIDKYCMDTVRVNLNIK